MRRTFHFACLGVLGVWACSSDISQPSPMIGTTPDVTAGTTPPGMTPSGVTPAPTTSGVPSSTAGSSATTTPAGTTPTQPTSMMMPNAMPGAAGSGASAMPPQVMEPACPKCPITPECRGFSFDGLKYSPGGDVLPNKCAPFHPTTNNPYAVRCIDAIPNFKTQFAGDEYCILPPPPDKGFQVGLHPHGNTAKYWEAMWAGDFSGYENPKKEWVLQPGDEITQNYRTRDAPNTTEMNYYRTYFRMRTGSHHMIVTMHDSQEADGWIPGTGEALPGLFDPTSGQIQGILGGEQRPDDNTPVTLGKPPEDEGLYLTFPPQPSIIFNMHHFNTTDKPLLREGWINIWKEDDARKRVSWYMGLDAGQVIALNVAPGRSADLHYSWSVNTDGVRLIRVFGHRHFWTTNFSTWIARKDGKIEPVYQSYDWFDMPTYRYDSVVQNPPLDPSKAVDGAASGVITMNAGDKLHFNCHIEFTEQRKATDPKAPTPSQIGTLRFANEAYNGEMCIQFGNVTGGALGLPAADSSPLPDFAKMQRTAATSGAAN